MAANPHEARVALVSQLVFWYQQQENNKFNSRKKKCGKLKRSMSNIFAYHDNDVQFQGFA